MRNLKHLWNCPTNVQIYVLRTTKLEKFQQHILQNTGDARSTEIYKIKSVQIYNVQHKPTFPTPATTYSHYYTK